MLRPIRQDDCSVGQLRRTPAVAAHKPFMREYALDMLDTSTIHTSMTPLVARAASDTCRARASVLH
jgi:hypothetical protein